MANVFNTGPFAAKSTGDASGARVRGMVNPLKMGLLGGLSGYLQGLSASQDAQRKLQGQSAIEDMKAKNNRLLKLLEVDANQREFIQHKVGADGKIYDQLVRRTYDSQTGSFSGIVNIGDPVPTKDPLAASNAIIASREKVAGMQIGAANSRNAATIAAENKRNADRLAAKNDPSVETAAERRNRVQQRAENDRAAGRDANYDMRDYAKADAETKAAMLKDAGITIDSAKDPAGAKKAYHDAVLAQHKSDYATGDATPPPQPGEASAHPDKTPTGQPIKYDADGNAYIKGADGKPVPYTPTAATSGLALDSDEAQQLAQDHPSMTGASEDDSAPDTSGEDQQDQALIAQQTPSEQPEDEETESPDDAARGMYPPGYPPKGPTLDAYLRGQNDDEEDSGGGILA